jgi:dTDP-4-amino-4,6-dideoxygalactose transaminase
MIFLSEPNISNSEKIRVAKALDSNLVSSFGDNVKKFEKKFSSISKFKYSLALNSGTSALHLALLVNKVKKDDLVIIPDYTFAATANAVIYCGASPWFHDINKESITLDLDQVCKSLSQKTYQKGAHRYHKQTHQRIACVILVTAFGTISNLKKINLIKNSFNLPVIIDGAAAHFAKYENKPLGKYNLDIAYSFNGNKVITTGSGGMFCTNNLKKYKEALLLTSVGQLNKKYEYLRIGYNYKMNNIQASIGLSQLDKYNNFYLKKKFIYNFYKKNILTNKIIRNFFIINKSEGAFWLYPLLIKKQYRHKFLQFLKIHKIIIGNFWKNLSTQTPYEKYLTEKNINSRLMSNTLICLPSSTFLKLRDLKKVKKIIDRFFKTKYF